MTRFSYLQRSLSSNSFTLAFAIEKWSYSTPKSVHECTAMLVIAQNWKNPNVLLHWMVKQTEYIIPYNTTQQQNRNTPWTCSPLVLKGIMLSKVNLTVTYRDSIYITFWNDKITDWEDISGYQGLGKNGRREVAVPIKRVAQETAELLYIQTTVVVTFIYSYAITAQNTYIAKSACTQ